MRTAGRAERALTAYFFRSSPTPLFTNCERVGLLVVEIRLDRRTGLHHLVEEALHARIGHGADAELRGVAGIDDAVFLHLRDREGDQLVGHVGIVALDQRVALVLSP